MKKVLSALFLCAVLSLAVPLTARADIGPKPSVRITINGLDGAACYGTLLSERRSTGPSSAWDGRSAPHIAGQEGGREIWEKFVSYEDSDGFCFLQEWWDCSESSVLDWTYHPPSPFKILLYFPGSDSFYISPVCEMYAFDSYFTVDLSDTHSGLLTAARSYDYTWEILSLAARILLTILLELAAALLFGYREKKVLSFIAVVNIVTQLGLNLVLNLVNYHSGPLAFTLLFLPLELAVTAIEAILYLRRLPAHDTKGHAPGRAAAYALAANAASFAAGLGLAHLIPGIF